MLTSQARETLRDVEAVIVDEIHALAATKRGAHLALTLERLEADHRPAAAAHRALGHAAPARGDRPVPRRRAADDDRLPRPVTIVDAGVRKELDIEVVVPVDDMGELGQIIEEPMSGPAAGRPGSPQHLAGHAPAAARARAGAPLHAHLRQRPPPGRAAGHPAQRARAGEGESPGRRAVRDGAPCRASELVKAHHGSLSRERRLQIEDELKSRPAEGPRRHVSSLELGIDMGAVDLVVQVESPRSVAAGLQRIGRAGHQVGEPSRGKLFPKHRADLVEAAVVVERMHAGLIEHTRYPRNPLDVLAQQIVAMCALDDWNGRRAAPPWCAGPPTSPSCPTRCSRPCSTCSPGRYPSEEFAELRPAHRVGPRRRRRARAGRRPAPRRHQRRHHPRPRAVRRLPARRHPGGRARRGDGLREPSGRDVPARRVARGASRTSPSSG